MDSVGRSLTSNESKSNQPCSISQPQILNAITNSANTPTEYSHRSSYGKDGGRDYEEKENEQDINPQHPRVGSPSVVKGSKNFMSPTISAASKINASPRKKVLVDRNEALRTSASYSAGKFPLFLTPPSETQTYSPHNHQNVPKLKPQNSPTTSMAATEFRIEGTDNLIEEPAINLTAADEDKNQPQPDVVVLSPFKCSETDCRNKESVTNIADSMLPPYDPENNYLSPRPRFPHYKLKPRVEAYVNHGIQFEDEIVPENSYETQGSNEETTPSKD